MLEGQDLYSTMTIMTICDISIIMGVIHWWTGSAKEKKHNMSLTLGLTELPFEFVLQIKCTDVQ